MSTEIKNTLYRFVSLRAPKPLRKSTPTKFVLHPNLASASNVYLKAVNAIPAGKTKKQQISDTTAGYVASSFKSVTDVKTAVGAAFFDFAEWLSASRTSLTVAEVSSYLPLSPLANETLRLQLWDNLFYQVTTFKSNYVREAILSVLVADLFLQQRTTVAQTDKAYRRLAQARVAIPTELFGIVPTASLENLTQAELDKIPVNVSHLQPDLEKALATTRISKYEKFAEEVKTAQSLYESANQVAYDAARASYDASIKAAYDAATYTEQTYVDKELGINRKYREYPQLRLPDFSYLAKEELDRTTLTALLSSEALAMVEGYKATKKVTKFSEVLELLAVAIKQEYIVVFDNSKLKGKAYAKKIARASFSTSGSMTTLKRPVFTIASNAIAGSKTGFTLVFEGLPDGIQIAAATYQIAKNGAAAKSYTGDYTTTNGNARTMMTIAENDPLVTDGATDITITGTLTYTDGSGAAFTGSVKPTTAVHATGSVKPAFTGSGTVTAKPLVLKDANGNIIRGSDKMVDYIPSGFGIKRLGIADYRKVEQEICCYVPGEVSHIENVMAREYKEKSARRLRRIEDTTTSSSERETEQLTDSSSTERFEMNREVASVIAEDSSKGKYNSYSASASAYGITIGVESGSDFSHNTSQEDSDSQSVTQAKEVTERALERVVRKVKEERISKVIEEYEENNKHGFDNRKGSQHISGVYRWVDKVYKNQIVNYGKRLMYEFMIPEPAAFHREAMTIALNAPEIPETPIDPRIGDGKTRLVNHTSITPENFEQWAALYNAQVAARPIQTRYIGKTFAESAEGGNEMFKDSAELDIPEGYYSKSAVCDYSLLYDNDGNQRHLFALSIGNVRKDFYEKANRPFVGAFLINNDLNPHYGSINVGFSSANFLAINAAISIRLELSAHAYEQWQLETFNAIISAYQKKRDAYDRQVADISTATEKVLATNPMFYRQIENTSLRKNCIAYLFGQENMGADMLNARDSIGVIARYNEAPLETYAKKVKFFEQAFEWDLMSYNFYPFYWANKDIWQELYTIESDDQLFRSFLQSGMARVILTVRPGFEEAVNWYMSTGQVWNGGKVPTLNDALFLSIVDELQDIGGVVEETWESRVPTTLTVIQAGTIGLNVEGLPCNPDCDEYKIFDAGGNVTGTIPNPIGQTNAQLGVDLEETPA